jgi:hypothetical protein
MFPKYHSKEILPAIAKDPITYPRTMEWNDELSKNLVSKTP